MKTGDNELIRNMNYSIILDTIRQAGEISRIDISRLTGLSRSTCSIICETMLAQNILKEKGKSTSSGGRKPVLLEINADAGSVISLKLMEGAIVGALVNFGGQVLYRRHEEIPRHRTPDDYLHHTRQFIAALRREAVDWLGGETGRAHGNIVGIGIGMSGRIDNGEGILLESSILEWKQVPVGKFLREQFGIPVFLENDVNTFAIGEKYFGAGKPYANFLCVTIGEGIGLGIILDGKLYRGHHHGAGEFGHTKISAGSSAPLCSCGKRGCLEAYAADHAIEQAVRTVQGGQLGIEEIAAAAAAGDPVCRNAFSRAAEFLGLGISTLINLFDPEAVIIGGERAGAAGLFMESLKAAVTENSVYELARDIEILALEPDIDHWLRGGATLAIDDFFSRPALLE